MISPRLMWTRGWSFMKIHDKYGKFTFFSLFSVKIDFFLNFRPPTRRFARLCKFWKMIKNVKNFKNSKKKKFWYWENESLEYYNRCGDGFKWLLGYFLFGLEYIYVFFVEYINRLHDLSMLSKSWALLY